MKKRRSAYRLEQEKLPTKNALSDTQKEARSQYAKLLRKHFHDFKLENIEDDDIRETQEAESEGYTAIERLLYYNPATVSDKLFSLFTTKEGEEVLASKQHTEYCHTSSRPGIEIPCLQQLLKTGLLAGGTVGCRLTTSAKNDPKKICPAYPFLCPMWDPTQTINLRSK